MLLKTKVMTSMLRRGLSTVQSMPSTERRYWFLTLFFTSEDSVIDPRLTFCKDDLIFST